MNYYLLHLNLYGIKNISEEIQLDFYNKFITTFNPDLYRIKAIYGENGSGKTAIMTAVNITKKILLSPDYLKQVDTQALLGEIINKKTNKFHIQFEFAEYDDLYLSTYRYELTITQNTAGYYEISSEKLDVINDYTKNKKYQNVFTVLEGQLVSLCVDEKVFSTVKESTLNVLRDKPFLIAVLFGSKPDEKYLPHLLSLFYFFWSINVYLEEEDMHEMYLMSKMFENAKQSSNMQKKLVDLYTAINRQNFYIDSKGRDVVDKKNFSDYEKKVSNLESFLKVFKKDLRTITIDKRDNGDNFVCELILDYGEYTVNREFESTGIKKIIRIYDALVNANSGGISFIDEMDSNINDVYLCKLVEYFMYYSKGQICFTTHNVDPMTVLKNNRNSIDFLSTDNKVTSWKVTGNAAPDRYYRNGMIENSPFNIDAIDFIGMFGE